MLRLLLHFLDRLDFPVSEARVHPVHTYLSSWGEGDADIAALVEEGQQDISAEQKLGNIFHH